MKKILFLFLLLNGSAFAQKLPLNKLYQNWVKTDVSMADGSKIYSNELLQSSLGFNFISPDSVYFIRDGKLSKYKYGLYDSTIVINTVNYKIKSLSDLTLQLTNIPPDGSEGLNIKLRPKNLNDLTFGPTSYLSKNNETVYQFIPGKLEPYFVDKNMTAMDFIADRFAFPEYKKGGFKLRFIINTEGKIKGGRVTESTNDRYNEKLVNALMTTQGKWLPASYLNEKVNVEIQYDFNLGYTDSNTNLDTDSLKFSDLYYGYGNDFFEEKSYKQALAYYTKSISYNPLNVNSYYQRAACNVFLRKKEDACSDYQQLVLLEQQKAKTLYDKFCN